MGKVTDLFFDDEKWTIRYLSADTRKWLPGRHVLLSPSSFKSIDTAKGEVNVSSDKDTVRDSPALEDHQEFTRNYEMDLTNYWGWTPYWSGAYIWGNHDTLTGIDGVPDNPGAEDNAPQGLVDDAEHNLKTFDEMRNHFIVHANDGKIGRIDDFLIDNENWKIRYLVIESSEEYPENYYLLSPDWIQSVDWVDYNVYYDLDKEVLKNGPGFPEKTEITKAHEEELHRAYRKRVYWTL